MSEIFVTLDGREQAVSAQAGESLLAALRRAGLPVTAPCGGRGTCLKCRVLVEGRQALACRTAVREGLHIELHTSSGGAILAVGADTAADPGQQGLGAAIDLGTTTVAVELLDLADGRSLGTASAWNAQAPYGADVITRCQYCMEHPDGVEVLDRVMWAQIDGLLASLGHSRNELKALSVAGNTVMQHLLAGLDPHSIALAPFTPTTLFDAPEDGPVRYAPCVAGYVGGDITAGLLASGLWERDERSLFLDIGTNGEMALGGRDGFLCCAVASGPAFEGAGIACGMAGVEGAVSHVRWDGDAPELTVIGGGAPRGICGSGLIDLAAVLCRKGIISGSGLLLGPEEAPEDCGALLGEDENGNGIFCLTADRSVYLTARDVRQLQLAKAAVAAGIRVLLRKAGLAAADVDRLYLAGGFGSYMDVENAAAIGMLPAELAGRTVLLGNASLQGARLALLQKRARDQLFEIRRRCRYLELSGDADFNREFPEQMYFYDDEDDL